MAKVYFLRLYSQQCEVYRFAKCTCNMYADQRVEIFLYLDSVIV